MVPTPLPTLSELSAILDAVGAMIITTDLEGTVRIFNPAAERMLGWRADEVIGKQTPALWHDPGEFALRATELSRELARQVLPGFDVLVAKAKAEGPEQRVWTFIRKDKSRFQAELAVSVLRDGTGRINGYLATAQKLTLRVQEEPDRDRFFDVSLDMLGIANTDGYFKRINPTFRRVLGWSEKEFLSRPFLDFVHPADQAATQHELEKLAAGEPTLHFENRYRCKDGSWRWVAWTCTPEPDGTLFAAGRDVTDLKQAEEELRQTKQDLEITINSIGDAVIVTDAATRITRMNPVAEQLTGWTQSEAIGRSIDEVLSIIDEETRGLAVNAFDDVLVTGIVHKLVNHSMLISRDGTERPIAGGLAPISEDQGAITGVVLVFRDVSRERDVESKLRNLNDDLERRVAERTKELAKETRRLRNGHLILESVASEAPLSESLELIVRFVTEEGASKRCGVLLFDKESEQLQLGAQRNLPRDFGESLLHRLSDPPINWIWQAVVSGERVLVEDLSETDWGERLRRLASSIESRSAWAEPIVAGDGRVLGVFITFSERIGPPGTEEATCIECACSLAKVAIERAQARVALEASETRYRTFLNHVPANVFVYDQESLAYLAVSDRAVREYGYSRDEFAQMTIADIRPQEDVPALKKMLSESGMAFENRGVWRHRKKDGVIMDVEITTHGIEVNGRPACIVLANDITHQLRAESALRRSEALNQAILQSSLDCILTMNEAGRIVEFNSSAERMFGYSRAEAVGGSMKEMMIPAALRAEHEQGLARYLATGEERLMRQRTRTTALRRNGETFPVELTVVPVEVAGERLFTAFIRDIALELRAEQELKQTTELLQAVADGSSDAIFVKDREGRYLMFNKSAAELTGRSVEEVLGENDLFLFGDEHGRIVMENDERVMQSSQPHILEEEVTAAGTTRNFQAMKAPLRDSEGRVVGLIGISREVTERKRMESALRSSEERYRSIIEHSPDMMFVNRDNCMTYINQAGIKLLRASSADEILGRSPLEFFHQDDQFKIRDRMTQLLSAPIVLPVFEKRLVALDGTVIDVDVQGASYYSDGRLEVQVVCRDVSERKKAERNLRRHVRHAEFTAAIGLALSKSATLPKMLQRCAEAMVAHLDAAIARVWALNAEKGMLELQANAGEYTLLDGADASVPVGQKKIGRIAATKLPHLTNSVSDDPQFGEPDWDKAHGLKSFAGYPLLIEDRCVGVVAMFSREVLEQDTLEYLEIAANGIAQNIERKHAEAKLAELNRTLERRVRERTLALDESEQFNRATLDALSSHVAVVDHDGNIVATNAQWRKFAEDNQIAYQSVSDGTNYLAVCDASATLGNADAAIVAGGLREVLAGQRSAWQHEYPCHSPTEQRWFICQITQGHIRQQPHAVVAHENVTSIKRVQEELRHAKEKAMQANHAKSEFLATMSHELRTPLNGILGMNELLLTTELSKLQRDYIAASQASGKLLAQLINDILDFSKIEAGKLELDPREYNMEAFTYDVVALMSHEARMKHLVLNCRIAPEAGVVGLFDDTRLRQVLVNLIGNAVKFTSSGSITVTVDRVAKRDQTVRLRFSVSDTGIGIPQSRLDRLFKSFSQVDSSTTRQFGGTGLGLSICKKLIKLMGGEIGVESQVGVGTTFWFEIEIVTSDGGRKMEHGKPLLAGTSIVAIGNLEPKLSGHILVAEDNRINQLYIIELLKHFGCTSDLVVNGEEALAAVQKQRYDLVLMDCQMPEMDGFSAALEIRKREAAGQHSERLPIVALTANALKGDRERCLAAGMDEYVSKPVESGQLKAVLAKYLTRISSQRDANRKEI